MTEFETQLHHLLSKEATDTPEKPPGRPDTYLARYLLDCLEAHEKATQARDEWYGLNIG